jgi:hypothetical protein
VAAVNSLIAGLSEREVSHIAFFGLLAAGGTEAALSALPTHLNAWPRDILVLSTTAFTNGLIGNSGRAGQKLALLALLERLAPSYGDDWWFTAHHGMVLSENGKREAARPRSNDPWLKTPTTLGERTRWRTFAMRREMQMPPVLSWGLGFPTIRGAARYTATSVGISHSGTSRPVIRQQPLSCSRTPSHPMSIAGRRAGG